MLAFGRNLHSIPLCQDIGNLHPSQKYNGRISFVLIEEDVGSMSSVVDET